MPPRIRPLMPRQPGETQYAYRNRRSLEIYGVSLYQRRIASAEARGMSRTSARGHVANEGQVRQNRFAAAHPTESRPYYVVYRSDLRVWLDDHGYTPENTGMTQTDLMRLGPRIRWMVENSHPASHITPDMIQGAVNLEHDGDIPPGWAADRIWQKYDDMIEYRQNSNKLQGLASWQQYKAVHEFVPDLAPAWWYYH